MPCVFVCKSLLFWLLLVCVVCVCVRACVIYPTHRQTEREERKEAHTHCVFQHIYADCVCVSHSMYMYAAFTSYVRYTTCTSYKYEHDFKCGISDSERGPTRPHKHTRAQAHTTRTHVQVSHSTVAPPQQKPSTPNENVCPM